MSEFVRLDFEAHPVRTMTHNGQAYFSLADVREAVGVVCWHPIGIHLDDAERDFFLIDTPYGQKRHPVVNILGACTVAARGDTAIGVRFVKWVLADAVPFVLAPRSATFIPQKSRLGLYSTTEIAVELGMSSNHAWQARSASEDRRERGASHVDWP